jgi:conserved oligomeric Golgi complex subunit 4
MISCFHPSYTKNAQILLNDLEISALHMDRLVKDLLSSSVISQGFPAEEVEAVRNSISSFSSIVPKFQSTLRVGVEQLFNQLLRPKLRTFLPDVYKDVSYVLDDDAYVAAEYQDVKRKRFIKAWEGLVDGYKVRCGKRPCTRRDLMRARTYSGHAHGE